MTSRRLSREAGPAPAIVLGLCAHGLATARSLWRAGIPVIALEQSREPPGCRTRACEVVAVPDLNGEGLVEALEALHRTRRFREPPVLFPINDNMVRVLGSHWDRLAGRYRLPWAAARERLVPLLEKIALERRCREVGLLSPRTWDLFDLEGLQLLRNELTYPVLVKPSRPLSSFKTELVDSYEALQRFVEGHVADLPLILQEWIEGPPTNLVFGALYLEEGEVRARFEGRKLRMVPRRTHQWSGAAEGWPDDRVHEATRRFFEGLQLSGPVSGEFKWSADGRLWFIEATVGRTDFWLACAIAGSVNLPLFAYAHACGQPPPAVASRRVVWFNTERDPLGPLWVAMRRGPALLAARWAFPFWATDDPAPFRAALRLRLARLGSALARRLRRLASAVGAAVPAGGRDGG